MLMISKELLKILNDSGYEAYLIGGVVRDYLIGINSYDVDIATSATPKEIIDLFPMGIPHDDYGCIKLTYKEINFEITTFRIEKRYEGRKPIEIEYIKSLEKDLLRRDFTINTLCMDKDGNIIDLLGAKKDLDNKLLKCVGDPFKKLSEDSLRILRGIRFASKYNLKIEKNTSKSIKKHKNLLSNISFNKRREELDKMFSGKKCKESLNLLRKYQIDKVLGLKNITKIKTSDNILFIWAQFDVEDIYPFSNNEKDQIKTIKYLISNKKHLLDKYLIYKYGNYLVSCVDKLYGGKNLKKINDIYSNLPITDKKDIDIKTEEIIDIIKREKGPWVKEIIRDIEKQIIYCKIDNKNETIKNYLIKRYVN